MRVLCVTSVRNEGPFLIEWVAHLRGAGVTDFLIYSNDCEDGTTNILDLLHKEGVIVHIPQVISKGESPQWKALKVAWKHPLRKACDWAIVCDVDEFVNIHTDDGVIKSLVSRIPANTEGMLLSWRLFGNNNHAFATDQPITEQFTASMAENCNYPVATTFFKSLIRTDGRFNQFGVHRPKQKSVKKAGLPFWINGSGQEMPDFFARSPKRLSLYGLPNGRDLVECNHYSLKSAEDFLVKRARGLPNRSKKNIDLAYWVERNFNTVENTSISNMRPNAKAQMAKLMSLPNLLSFHNTSITWHREKFKKLIQQESEHQLFSQLMVAGESREIPTTLTRQIINWYQPIYHAKMATKTNSNK